MSNTPSSTPNFRESSDLANLRLKLRSGLEFEFQENGAKQCYVVNDDTSANYFQIGVPEYAFVSLLDGQTSLQQAVQETATRLGDDAISIAEATRIGHWLLETGLANAVDQNGTLICDPITLSEKNDQQSQQKLASQLNPMFVRLPLGCPQKLIESISPMLGWIGSRWFAGVWCVVAVFAVFRIFQQPELLAQSAQGLLAPNTWAWMLATLVGLKIIHELAHGLFCHRFGGRVKECGLVFILFVPLPFVDVTSCWSFPSKWKRIAVSAAGMYVELFVAAVATIVWSFSHDPVLRFHLFNVMLLGSLTTVLFNANFLMRFDGYYILSDLLEIPNLYQSGQRFVSGFFRRILLGTGGTNLILADSLQDRVTIRAYGIAAFVWRILICVSLAIIATALLYGFGRLLAFVGIAMWIGTPIVGWYRRLKDPSINSRPNFRWISTVSIPATLAIGGAICLLPWPVNVSSPAIVEYESPAIVRVEQAGFVTAVHVVDGQEVSCGDLLVELENRDLALRLKELQLEREKSFIRSRSFHHDSEIASYQAENASRQAIETQIAELQRKADSLRIVATADGVVLGEQLETLPGRFVSTGSSIMQVVDERRKIIAVSIGQDQFKTFAAHDQNQVRFLPAHGYEETVGVLERVQPVATAIANVRLTTRAGGSLAIRGTEATAEKIGEKGNDDVELLSSRLSAKVSVAATLSQNLRVGSVGHIYLDQYDKTIAETLVLATRRWLERLMREIS